MHPEHDGLAWRDEFPDASLQRIREHLHDVRQWSAEMRIPRVERVAAAALRLLDGPHVSMAPESELLDTMFWSLSLLAVLMDDAMESQAHPSAALHDAVRTTLEEIAPLQLLLMPRTITH